MEPIVKLSVKKDCKDSLITFIVTSGLISIICIMNIIEGIKSGFTITIGLFILLLVVCIVTLILKLQVSISIYQDRVVYTNMFKAKKTLLGNVKELEFSFLSGTLLVTNKVTNEVLKAPAIEFNKKSAEKLETAGLKVLYHKG